MTLLSVELLSCLELENKTVVSGLTKCVRSCLQNSGIRIVTTACGSSQRDRFVLWIDVLGIGADEDDQFDGIDDFVGKHYAYLVTFTTDASNRQERR